MGGHVLRSLRRRAADAGACRGERLRRPATESCCESASEGRGSATHCRGNVGCCKVLSELTLEAQVVRPSAPTLVEDRQRSRNTFLALIASFTVLGPFLSSGDCCGVASWSAGCTTSL